MIKVSRIFAMLLGGLATIGASQGTSQAAQWPERPITLIVPFSAGGIVDTIARTVAQPMSESLGQPIIVENRAGASATIGTAAAARAAPDGYTLMLGSDSSNVLGPLLYKSVKFSFDKSFDSIGEIGDTPFALVVNASFPVKDVRQFVEYARSHQGQVNYVSTGVGGAYHLAAELFAEQNGIKLTHIPYKGGGEFITSLISGETQAAFGALVTFAPHVAAGKLRALAVSADHRLSSFPDLPTFKDAGFPNYAASARFGLVAPKGTPAPIRDRLTKALNLALADRRVHGHLEQLGLLMRPETSAETYRKETEADIAKWSALIQKLDITLN